MKPTKEQMKVIKCKDPVISLNAPHGTGKTKTLAWFIVEKASGGKYKHILAVTLTKEAAKNMEEELKKLGPALPGTSVTFSTFHSFSYGVLRANVSPIGFRQNILVDQGINTKLIKKMVIKDKGDLKGIDKPIKAIVNIYKKHVCSGLSILNAIKKVIDDDSYTKVLKIIIKKIKKEKVEMNVMDFDDMIYYFWKLLKQDDSFIGMVVCSNPLMVVDEFQDITQVQWKIMKLLINKGMYFLGTGDPYQTIYRFVGASFKRFDHLEKIKQCHKFHLTQNHRTTNEIIALSNAVRSQIKHYNRVKMWSQNRGPKPKVIFSYSKNQRVKGILKKIRFHMKKGVPLKEMAILSRFDKDLKYPSEIFVKEKLPHKTFLKDNTKTNPPLIELFLSIIKISQNQGNGKIWGKILPYLKGVGDKSLKMILTSLKETDYRYEGLDNVPGKRFNEDLNRLRNLFKEIDMKKDEPTIVLQMIKEFCSKLKKVGVIDSDGTGLITLINIAKQSSTIGEFLLDYQDIPYRIYHPYNSEHSSKEYLTLSNIHKAKGKGFKVVFILGPYDHNFEDKNFGTFKNDKLITDEIMIIDTAITRCSRHLYFLFPMTYKEWKNKSHKKNPSIFIRNCSKKLYNRYSIEDVKD